MNKPYIICHMMTSVDGRIDCAMTAQLTGEPEYYRTLNQLDAPSRISGKVTAATELTQGAFSANDQSPVAHEAFQQNKTAERYNIVMDTKGTLQWAAEKNTDFPHLIIMSEQASSDYLDYLNQQGISWIVTGKQAIDLPRAMDILRTEFGITRVAIAGGGRINGAFLDAGLIDEVSVLIGSGIDGRRGQPALFDGRSDSHPVGLKLKDIQSYADGAVWLRYLAH